MYLVEALLAFIAASTQRNQWLSKQKYGYNYYYYYRQPLMKILYVRSCGYAKNGERQIFYEGKNWYLL